MARWLNATVEGPGPAHFEFAVAQSAQPVRLVLECQLAGEAVPALNVTPAIEHHTETQASSLRCVFVCPPPADPGCDDRVELTVTAPGIPTAHMELRRSTCQIETALLSRGEPGWQLDPQTRAALLWLAWGRHRELVGLKRIAGAPLPYRGRGGLSGSDVLLFRPRLRAPGAFGDALASSGPLGVLDRAWGGWLLVKSGPVRVIRREWDRFRTFLADRLSPFLARPEAFLEAQPPGQPAPSEPRATLVSTFLGGDILQAETLESRILGADSADACRTPLARAFDVLAPWHAAGETWPLSSWTWAFSPVEPGVRPETFDPQAHPWLLFRQYDLAKERRPDAERPFGIDNPGGREDFTAGLRWDTHFRKGAHLGDFLLGQGRDGLLYQLMTKVRARFTLTHGDLHPRNILCDDANSWLIDFEQTRVAPALADFARLEANLRLWCLHLRSGGPRGDDAAGVLEAHLLDHFLGSEASLAPVRGLAEPLGADPDELVKVARCIGWVRSRAAVHCLPEYADRRDYLAVLYVTVLGLLPYARIRSAPVANFRLLLGLAWVLEETLAALLGKAPYDRQRAPFEPLRLISPRWLAAPAAPGRVDYFLQTPDGRTALPDLDAMRGVAQNLSHHLDVYDHTLLVLAYLEAILESPLPGLLDPAGLDRRVEAALREQGLDRLLQARHDASPGPPSPPGWSTEDEDRARHLLDRALDEPSRIRLKWCALLHDVGKPATRLVTRTPGSPEKVQFIGHEYYSLAAVGPLLDQLFTEPGDREAVLWLIEQHHFANQRLPNPLAPPTAGQVRGWVNEVGGAENFARLLVHGIADRMARRGPDNRTTLQEELTFYLAALACAARLPSPETDGRLRWLRGRLQEVLAQQRLSRDEETRVRREVLGDAQVLLDRVLPGDDAGLVAALEAAVQKALRNGPGS
jgi:hypothetical protein